MLPPTAQVGGFYNIRPDWVFGFFRDPDTLQQPIIMGVLPCIPSTASEPTKGFSDPNSPDAPDTQDSKYKKEPDFEALPYKGWRSGYFTFDFWFTGSTSRDCRTRLGVYQGSSYRKR